MGAKSVTDKFYALCGLCQHLYDTTLDSRDLELGLRQVLELVKANPEFKPEFVKCFIDLVHDRSKGPVEIIEYCMHEFRWEEVREAAYNHSRLAGNNWDVKQAMAHVLEAYQDAWDSRDLYVYYGGPEKDRNLN